MVRVSDDEKARTHERIVRVASEMLRERGLEETSVGDVMKAARLTHGGFYKHFSSKEDMLAEALRHAVDSVLSKVEESDEAGGRDAAIRRYLDVYLSLEHVGDRSLGCPLAAVAGEALRHEGPIREASIHGLHRTTRLLASLAHSENGPDASRDLGFALASVLVGTLTLARVVKDRKEAEKVLAGGRRTIEMLLTAASPGSITTGQ